MTQQLTLRWRLRRGYVCAAEDRNHVHSLFSSAGPLAYTPWVDYEAYQALKFPSMTLPEKVAPLIL